MLRSNYSICLGDILMIEEWKDIKGYEGYYQVSNTGKVKSLDRKVKHPKGGDKIVRGKSCGERYNRVGYPEVVLFKEGEKKYQLIHRLVALTFVPNEENKPEVNHIDGNKINNNAENLEWCTSSENQQHAYRTGLQVGKKGPDHPNYGKYGSKSHNAKAGKIKMPCGDIIVFKAQSELCKEFNLCPGHITSVLSGKRNHHQGWTKV